MTKFRQDDFQRASNVPFDNEDNDFDNDDVQAAIEEIDFRQIIKEPTGFMTCCSSTISFDNGTRTFTITPVMSSFIYYIRGHKHVVESAKSIQIDDTEGTWYIHFDHDQVLVASQTPWAFESPIAFVVVIYWDATNNKYIFLADERHGLSMSWATHKRLHLVEGTKVENGGFLPQDYILEADGSLDTHAQIGFSDAYVHDEDLIFNVVNSATPTNPFEQTIRTIGKLPVYYRDGVNGYWRKIDADNFSLADNSPNTIYYNQYSGGTWSLQNATNEYHVVSWVAATNNIEEPLVVILGQREDITLILSAANNPVRDLVDLPIPEMLFLYRLIFQTDTNYTNNPNARLRAITAVEDIVESNDRYAVMAWYTGNAGKGKYLDFFSGNSSDDSPFVFPEESFIKTLVISTTQLSTVDIGFFDTTDLVNPFYTLSLINEDFKNIEVSILKSKNDKIAIRILNGSLNNPTLEMVIQTTLV